jgi:hypothetical protein
MHATWPRWTPRCAASPAQTVARPASFAAQADKRATLELAIDHLLAQAPTPAEEIALPATGSPWAACWSTPPPAPVPELRGRLPGGCAGRQPRQAATALHREELRAVRAVRHHLPRIAITCSPGCGWPTAARRARRCGCWPRWSPTAACKCGKPFGTLRAIENMLSKLAGHSAFQGAAAERLKMCGDCRVIDIYTNPNEVRITDL